MKEKIRAFVKKPFLLFAVAAALLLLSTVGSTRAALTYYSESYEMRIEVPSIGVSLVENGQVVSHRNYVKNEWKEEHGELLADMLEKDEKLTPGKKYPEVLKVRNSGSIDSYVRVTLYRYWTKDGEKVAEADTELAPEMIGLNLLDDGWVEDAEASTRERMILYYTRPLPSGQDTTAFCDLLQIDPGIGEKVTETTEITSEGKVTTTVFAYDGYRFNIEAEVDAVQTHSAVEAIKSAWGLDVTLAEDKKTLVIPGGRKPGSQPEQPGGDGGDGNQPGGNEETGTQPGGNGGDETQPGGDGGDENQPGGNGGDEIQPGGDEGTGTP